MTPLARTACRRSIGGLVSAALLALSAGCASVTPPAPTAAAPAAPAVPTGEVKEGPTTHDADSLRKLVREAQVALPAAANAGTAFFGKFKDVPATAATRVPVVVFLHGSSGLGLAAIGEWQRWLATQGIASIAPDSFQLAGRLTYKSPVDKAVYERVHALRASEVAPTVAALATAPWADSSRLVLAGTSEGATTVARHPGTGFRGRVMYAWSCEDNYFTAAHGTNLPPEQPVLNVISLTDPFFSPANSWIGNPQARGHCGAALLQHKNATVVLMAGAPHTLLMLPAARHATAGFLQDLLKP
jgi:dienelactone hydrolase